MKRRNLWSKALCAVLAASLLAGCGASGGNASAPESAAGSEAADGKLTVSVTAGGEDAMVVNTALSGTLEGLSACRHLYEGLYKLDKDGNVVLGQAASAETSEDGLTWTFKLRDDINWSDGKAVTAADFVYGWKYLKECASDYSSLLDMVVNAEATDDKTLVVTLAYPCSYFPSVLAFPSAYPVREDIVAANGEAYATDPDKAVYNGPYAMTAWSHQQELTMEARPEYYDADSITVGTLNWELMTDQSTMMNSFKSGDVIYSSSYPEQEGAALEGNGRQFAPGYQTYCVMFNVSESGPEPLKDARVRKAMSLAIDRDRLISIRNRNDEFADTYAPSGLQNEAGVEFNSTVTPWFNKDDYAGNCEEAKQLMADAGYADGAGFPSMTYIVNNDNTKEIAEAILSDWKEVLGIDSITVETVDGFYAQRQDKNYDLAYYAWYMDYPDMSNMLNTMLSGANDAGYANPAYDEAYNAAVATADPDEQWKNYAKCEEILAEDVPVAPLLHEENTYLFDDAGYNGLVYYCGNTFFGFVQQN